MTNITIEGNTNETNLVLNSASATISDSADSGLVEMKALVKEMDYLASYDDTLYTLTEAGVIDWSNNATSDYILHDSPQAGALLTQRDMANWVGDTLAIKIFRAPWNEAFGQGMEPKLTISLTESWDVSRIKLNLLHLRNEVINSLPQVWPLGTTVTSEINLSFNDFIVKFQKYPLGVDKYEDFKAYGNGLEVSYYNNDFNNDKFGGIFTKNAYNNYVFECDFEFRELPGGQLLRGGGQGYDSGIFFHAQPPNTMVTRNYPIPDGHKSFQVNCGTQMIFKCPVNSGMAIFGDITFNDPSAASANVVTNLPGVVVKYKIECKNDTAKIYYNDLLGHELTGLDRSSGHIGFQSEGKGNFRVTNMKLKPLP